MPRSDERHVHVSALTGVHVSALTGDARALTVDPLRERLAAPELEGARRVLEHGGLPALIAWAREQLARIEARRARFEILSRDLERHPTERDAVIEAYLRETVPDPKQLARDLSARRKSGGELVDLATLGERVVRSCAEAERAADAALALARSALAEGFGPPTDLSPLFDLARIQGQWSRRAEALALLADLARLGIGREGLDAIATVARALTRRDEHRWVQPAALATLAVADPAGGIAIARDRLASPERGDDFLVRERILELAARGAFGEAGWGSLVNLALADPSEHVRLTLARGERDPVRLERLLHADASAKVRAVAAIGLATHDPTVAIPALLSVLRDETHDLVVRTAAEELSGLARRDGIADVVAVEAVLAALAHASDRAELSPSVRTRVGDALAQVTVYCDPIARAVHDLIAPIVSETPVGSRSIIRDALLETVDDARLGRVLAVLAIHDFALGVDRIDGGIVLHRGERRTLALWRVIHEVMHPGPSKRQAFVHTVGRRPGGALRAPPGGLAELTATQVPGERVMSERAGGWGRHLPLVDDLLSTGVLRKRTVALVASTGTTTIIPPSSLGGRLRGWLSMTFGYADLAGLRRRALDSDEPTTQVAYVNEIARRTGITVAYTPHTFTTEGAGAGRVAPRGLAPKVTTYAPEHARARGSEAPSRALSVLAPGALGMEWQGLGDLWRDLVQYATSPHGNRLPHLAAYATVMLGAFLVRGVAIRRSIEHDRAAIPLVIGGWGTRGKSGTERLKAALFQGLGHECLVKTTGCEAMFIHAVPGQAAREVFIYRPYDKATVWEQRDVLALARALGVRVFLWECMALQPDLVNLLQSQWMRDDFSTITNAYPDHEDVQGPSGHDVATVISEFVPTRGNLLTAEEQMLPILRERARERGTAVRVVAPRDADLIADDVLSRFPYAEHPRNVALVMQLARTLGVPSAVALAEMADHVVPDLGVLKDYPTVPHRGRALSFVNGMSANERTAALGNWVRTGFAAHDPESDPAQWVVTVINNRADRVARSEVFARFVVEDAAAHRHVLIGTNVRGLRAFIDAALDRHLAAISPTFELDGDGTERLQRARSRLERAFAKLKIVRLDADSVTHELMALGAGGADLTGVDTLNVDRLLAPREPGERYEAARAAVAAALPEEIDDELRPFLVSTIARRRAVRAVHAALARDLGSNPVAVDAAFARTYRAIFAESIVSLEDPDLTGDQVLDRIARSVPPGAHARIMGAQNIKGTGLDFVYRWVSIDMVHKYLALLESPIVDKREEALRALSMHGDYGLLDARLALERIEQVRAHDPHAGTLPYDVATARLREVVAARERKLVVRRGRSVSEVVRGAIGKTFDYLDATRRRRMASELLAALVSGRVSHAAAARKMREIVARTKGAWMQRLTA
ncbi:MAG: hypothetical protein HYV09_23010 [Deltaproteobacteria bacterium]|nr:hypothetical protein [Deltaproteobacteria bacterium]